MVDKSKRKKRLRIRDFPVNSPRKMRRILNPYQLDPVTENLLDATTGGRIIPLIS